MFVKDWDHQQAGSVYKTPYAPNQYLVNLQQDSEFAELYGLQTLPKQMIIKKDGTISHFGVKLSESVL